MDDDIRDLMRRAASQVEEVDLVPDALAGATTRRRRRVVVRIGGLAAAAVTGTALVLALNGPDHLAGPSVDPAGVSRDPSQHSPSTEPEDQTEEAPAPRVDLPDPLDPQVHATAESIAVLMEQETWIDDAACQARVLRTEDDTSWAWVRCTGEPLEAPDGEAREQSGPVRFDGGTLDVPSEPPDSAYAEDVRALFPDDLADLILEYDETELLPDVVTGEELGAARLLIATADDGTIDTSVLPLAPTVRLALGPEDIKSVPASQLTDPKTWQLDHPDGHFRAYVGPFSALDLLAPRPGWAQTENPFVITAGPHPHCASPPVPPPTGTEGLRQVSIRPGPGVVDSCLAWSTVDLYLDDGLIQVISLDLYEP